MAQIKSENIEIWGILDKECRICKEEKEKSIFYFYGEENLFYICEECFKVIEALFIDVLLEREDKYTIKPNNELQRISRKIDKIKKMRSNNKWGVEINQNKKIVNRKTGTTLMPVLCLLLSYSKIENHICYK